jgi:hypothetical protein
MPKKDLNQIAASILKKTIGEESVPIDSGKNPAAVALGKLGGLKGGRARAKALTPQQRAEIARTAAAARWKKG